jgi:pilus assembly protein CpaC
MKRAVLQAVVALAAMLTIAAATPAAALELIGGNQSRLTLDVGTGQLLRMEAPAASVLVADPDIADVASVSQNVLWVYGILPGETNVFALDQDDNLLANVVLTVRQSTRQVGAALRQLSPNGGIDVMPVGEDSLMLNGDVDYPGLSEDAARIASAFVPRENVINNTSVTGPTQINVRIRFAEVSRTAIRDLGIEWNAVLEDGLLALTGGTFGFTGFPATVPDGENFLFGTLADTSTYQLDLAIRALEEENLAVTLAEPNLTTVSGQPATFLAGGEFPFPTVDEDGNLNVEFKQFGVSLGVTPTLIGRDRISMIVRPEVSALNFATPLEIGGFTIPALTTRRADTTVEVGSGQSFAIAGLFDSTLTDNADNVPFLSQLPIIGQAFRQQEFQSDETELVIILTPYLVEPPARQADVMAPSARLSQSTEQNVEQRVVGAPSTATTLSSPDADARFAGGRVSGGAGFILD